MASFEPRELLAAVRRARLFRIIAVYVGASYIVLEAVDILADQLGLPDWFFPGALALLLVGLPIILTTALVQSGAMGTGAGTGADRSGAQSLSLGEPLPDFGGAGESEEAAGTPGPGAAPGAATEAAKEKGASRPEEAHHWLTWRRAILGGVLAFALLGAATTGYMVMRVLGIGPVGSLVAAGTLEEGERLIVADFENNTDDPALAGAVAEALRIDLATSPVVRVVDPAGIGDVLARMERPAEGPLTEELAREVAVRDGVKAVVAGEINELGSTFVVSTRLVEASSGQAFAAFRETARDSTRIIDAVDGISKDLRAKIGESLSSVRQARPLEAVTTGSLEALRAYSQAVRALEVEGDNEKGIALLEEAVRRDTAFAMAWRKLAVTLNNLGEQRSRAVEAFTRALEHGDRLSDLERWRTTATYHLGVTDDREKAITAYRTLLDRYPDESGALNNLSILLAWEGNYDAAEELADRALAIDSTSAFHYFQKAMPQIARGNHQGAARTVELARARLPDNPWIALLAGHVAFAGADYAAAEAELLEGLEDQAQSPTWQDAFKSDLARMARAQGHLAESERYLRERLALADGRELSSEHLLVAGELAGLMGWYRGAPDRGAALLDRALREHPLDSIQPLDWPFLELAMGYAFSGRPGRGREILERYELRVPAELRRREATLLAQAWGNVHLAAGEHGDAIRAFRRFHEGRDFCQVCAMAELGRAHDAAGQADSAVVYYERYVETPWIWRAWADAEYLGFAYERLGALYEERGDREKARLYYGRLADLWADADPELGPRVEAARRALASLSGDR